jgi:hypothetical protein
MMRFRRYWLAALMAVAATISRHLLCSWLVFTFRHYAAEASEADARPSCRRRRIAAMPQGYAGWRYLLHISIREDVPRQPRCQP